MEKLAAIKMLGVHAGVLEVQAWKTLVPMTQVKAVSVRPDPWGGNPARYSVSNRMLTKMLLVFAGAGTGGLCRWGIQMGCERWLGKGFPFGTLLVNIAGCLAVGFLAAILTESDAAREHWRLAIIVGFLGGFTTFSAFGRETFMLSSGGHQAAALANVLLSVGLGVLAVWVGAKLGASLNN
jgi:CrcB protein